MKKTVVVGYATLDYVLTTASPLHGPGTVPATMFTDGSWPRAGGAALYAARRLAAAGHAAWPLVTIGDDANGLAYRRACSDAALGDEGIVAVKGQKTPSCLLIYHDDGRYTCLLDRGSDASSELTPRQLELLEGADMVAIAATSADLTRDVLGRLAPSQRVAWIAKDDPLCFPPELCSALSRRADYLFYNAAERHLIEPHAAEAKENAVLFETQGASGVRIRFGPDDRFLGASLVNVADATGAGDTFAGEVLAHMLGGDATPIIAAERAVEEVRQMLLARMR